MSRLTALLGGTALVVVLGVSAYFALAPRGAGEDRFAQCRETTIAGGSNAIGGPFELVDGTGKTRRDSDVITGPTLIYFGYTFCPDVCPLDVARNADAVALLEEQDGIEATPVFITIDPARDTPEVVGEYASIMHDRMIGLTGTPEQVKAASQAYKTYYKAHEAEDEFYLVDHSTFSYLAFPEEGVVEIFRRDMDSQSLANSMKCFAESV
ncbi:MAG: SCO family protein [Pseudomonadota bacterium]